MSKKSSGQAGSGNREMYDAMMERRRSSVAQPHRNRARYNRNDGRKAMQKGAW